MMADGVVREWDIVRVGRREVFFLLGGMGSVGEGGNAIFWGAVRSAWGVGRREVGGVVGGAGGGCSGQLLG